MNRPPTTHVFIQPAADHVESMDWASMLLAMYAKWAEKHGFSIELQSHPGEKAGIMFGHLTIKAGVLEKLGKETGIHRFLRISPHDSKHRRHTSFASVMVADKPEELPSGTEDIRRAEAQRIRSYVLWPYTLVTDHRSGKKSTEIQSVLAGDLDLFLE